MISFRGADDPGHWIGTTLNARFENFGCIGCKVHDGYEDAYTGMKSDILAYISFIQTEYMVMFSSILVTGHGLGGALATLAAYDL